MTAPGLLWQWHLQHTPPLLNAKNTVAPRQRPTMTICSRQYIRPMENTAFMFPISYSQLHKHSAALCHPPIPQIQVSPSLDHRVEQHQYIDWCQEYGPSTTLAAYIQPSHKYQVNQTSSALATNWMHHPPFQNHPSPYMSLRRGPVALVSSNFLVNITELISPPRQLIRKVESQFLLRLNMNASSRSSLYVIPS
jgi:hypothetical protein